MLDRYSVPCRQCFTVQYIPVGCVPVIVICLLTFVTSLDAAALNRTGPVASEIIPADQLQPIVVDRIAQESNIHQVNSLAVIELTNKVVK